MSRALGGCNISGTLPLAISLIAEGSGTRKEAQPTRTVPISIPHQKMRTGPNQRGGHGHARKMTEREA